MKRSFIALLIFTAFSVLINKSFAQSVPASTALSGIGDESDYYKFASLVRKANLDATLTALGSYTVFAPDNVTFRNMSPGKLDSLTADPSKMAMVLKTHIVKGKYPQAAIIKLLTVGKGKATLTNILGQPLKLARTKDNKLLITDVNGTQASFLGFDMKDPHGVIHGISNLLGTGK
jgi:uncharacterized surface protein with fasciclin (FAS1) repeats